MKHELTGGLVQTLRQYPEIAVLKTLAILLLLGTALFFATSLRASPKIMILATGGTIADARTSTTEVGYKSGSFSVDDLIKAVPAMTNIPVLSGEQVANVGLETTSHEVGLKLVNRITRVLKRRAGEALLFSHVLTNKLIET